MGMFTLHTPWAVGTQGGVGAPWHPLEMLDVCRGRRMWGSPAPGKKEGKQGEQQGGRKCLFQDCHSKQSAPGNFASSVFALNSCFPTVHTDFGGPPAPEPVPGGLSNASRAGAGRADESLCPHSSGHELPHASTGKQVRVTTPELSPSHPSGTPGLRQLSPPLHPRLTPSYTSLFINNIKYTSCFPLFSLNRLLNAFV